MADLEEESRKIQYPLDSKCYKIVNEIGRGASAIVYKALCIPLNSSVVAIKSIDLDQSKADFDNVRREAKTVSLLSHPNILKAHCCFTVDRRLWVVMPFMSAGSLQSIIASSFPDGLPEPCISVILKETLRALSYLHDQGHLHRDVKAGNILMDSDGSVKLADFGVSASIYESSTSSSSFRGGGSAASYSQSLMLTDVAGTPYWMAPEVIHSHTGYSFKADIWSFGITAMELAHGRPPLSHLPPSKSLLMRITKQFRFSDYEKTSVNNNNSKKKMKFSKYFKEMVGLCLDQDPSKRPSAHKLLKHSFFRYCKGTDFLVKNLLQGLPSVEQRFTCSKLQELVGKDNEEEEDITGDIVKQRRISGWNFNLEDFELNPIFPTETEDNGNDNDVVNQVRFGGETFIQEDKVRDDYSDGSSSSNSGQVVPENQNQLSGQTGDGSNESIACSCTGFLNHQEIMLKSLFSLKKGLEDQRSMVMKIIAVVMGKRSAETSREEQLIMAIEKLNKELDTEKKKNSELELQLEFLKVQFSNE